MQKTKLLLIGNSDDLATLADCVIEQFPDIQCQFQPNAESALEHIESIGVELIVFHWKRASDRKAFDSLVGDLRASGCKTPVIVVSGLASSEVALHALGAGAVDCMCTPFNKARLVFLVGSLTVRADRCSEEPANAANRSSDVPVFLQSATMRSLMDDLRLAARSNSTVLLMGETGTGKNRLATFAHGLSSHRHEPLVTVDCGASSEALIESELFGHVRGAFTGADQNHVGKLERVGKGTVLLDEIDCLPMRCQSRLLRVLEERVFEKVGDERTRPFQGRVIALTNSSLEQDVAARKFRKDLFYRLNVIAFTVPPLRERSEDVAPLAKYFLQRLSAQRPQASEFSDAAMRVMTQYSWPGNVRELRNVTERALALSDDAVIEPRHLNLPLESETLVDSGQGHGSRLAHARCDGERKELVRVLENSGNNRTRAARHLGISRAAFYKRLDKLGLC